MRGLRNYYEIPFAYSCQLSNLEYAMMHEGVGILHQIRASGKVASSTVVNQAKVLRKKIEFFASEINFEASTVHLQPLAHSPINGVDFMGKVS